MTTGFFAPAFDSSPSEVIGLLLNTTLCVIYFKTHYMTYTWHNKVVKGRQQELFVALTGLPMVIVPCEKSCSMHCCADSILTLDSRILISMTK